MGKPFARQTWAIGLDEDGRPIEDPETIPSKDGALVYPDDDGVANWYSPTYSPQTNLIYQNVRERAASTTWPMRRTNRGRSTWAPAGALCPEKTQGIPACPPPLDERSRLGARGPRSTLGGADVHRGRVGVLGTMEGDFFAADARIGRCPLAIPDGRSGLREPDHVSQRGSAVHRHRRGKWPLHVRPAAVSRNSVVKTSVGQCFRLASQA